MIMARLLPRLVKLNDPAVVKDLAIFANPKFRAARQNSATSKRASEGLPRLPSRRRIPPPATPPTAALRHVLRPDWGEENSQGH
jgi:hypothetical protein